MVAHPSYALPAWTAPAPAQPPPRTPAMLEQQAQSVLPALTNGQVALLYATAFCMLLPSETDHVFRPQPRDVADVAFLQRGHLVVPQRGGYVLGDLGHAVISQMEQRHLAQVCQQVGR
jgi:hypothetical protein